MNTKERIIGAITVLRNDELKIFWDVERGLLKIPDNASNTELLSIILEHQKASEPIGNAKEEMTKTLEDLNADKQTKLWEDLTNFFPIDISESTKEDMAKAIQESLARTQDK